MFSREACLAGKNWNEIRDVDATESWDVCALHDDCLAVGHTRTGDIGGLGGCTARSSSFMRVWVAWTVWSARLRPEYCAGRYLAALETMDVASRNAAEPTCSGTSRSEAHGPWVQYLRAIAFQKRLYCAGSAARLRARRCSVESTEKSAWTPENAKQAAWYRDNPPGKYRRQPSWWFVLSPIVLLTLSPNQRTARVLLECPDAMHSSIHSRIRPSHQLSCQEQRCETESDAPNRVPLAPSGSRDKVRTKAFHRSCDNIKEELFSADPRTFNFLWP